LSEQSQGQCLARLSLSVNADFEVDTVLITLAASDVPTQIDAVELVGELQGFLDLPVFWRVPLPGAPISLAAGQNGRVYVAVDPDGYFHASDLNRDELYAYDVEGNQLQKFNIPTGSNLTDIASDSFGNLAVVDDTYGWFVVLTPEGRQLLAGGEALAGQIAVSPVSGDLYVLQASAITVYSGETGKLLRQMPLDDLHSYTGLSFDPQGRLATLRDADWAAELLQLDPLTGEEWQVLPLERSGQIDIDARDLAIDAGGNFYILFLMNSGDVALEVFAPNGTFLKRFGKLAYDPADLPEGVFFEPRAIAVTPDGRFVIIADGNTDAYFLTAFLLETEE